jgi:hypothetical protein
VKADVIRAVTRADLDADAAARLRTVVMSVVDGYDRREFRSYIRLAKRVDTPELRSALRSRLEFGERRAARHAEWVLAGLDLGR